MMADLVTDAPDDPKEVELVDTIVAGLVGKDGGKRGLIEICGLTIALRRRVITLEQEVDGLLARKVPQYRGHWNKDDGTTYDEADMVTYGGSVWYATCATSDKPSTHSDTWVLAVKAGRDGRTPKDAPQ
jgi:hypothetical protein